MKQKIKVALYVRLAFVLIGPGLYLLINNFISSNHKGSAQPLDNGRARSIDFTSRRVLGVRDQAARDGYENHPTAARLWPEGEVDVVLTPRLIPRAVRKAFRVVGNVVVSCYCFLMLAILCDEYFIGSIEILCKSQ